MKALWITVLVLIAAGAGWRNRMAIEHWLAPPPPPRHKPIVFDNGSVRDVAPPASRPLAAAARADGLRKCVRASQTTYTNFDCPPGFKEKSVSTDRVTVLEAQAGGTTAPAKAKVNGAQRRLQDALDLSADDQLRERMMDRAIEAGSR